MDTLNILSNSDTPVAKVVSADSPAIVQIVQGNSDPAVVKVLPADQPAEVKIIPSEEPAVVKLINNPGPEGPEGPQGIQGPKGDKGDPGQDATGNSEILASGNNTENVLQGIENVTTFDSFSANEFRTVKYFISVSKITNGDNKFFATEITVLVDESGITVSEYASVDNDGDMGTINVTRFGDNVDLIYSPNLVIKPVTLRYYRTGLKA